MKYVLNILLMVTYFLLGVGFKVYRKTWPKDKFYIVEESNFKVFIIYFRIKDMAKYLDNFLKKGKNKMIWLSK